MTDPRDRCKECHQRNDYCKCPGAEHNDFYLKQKAIKTKKSRPSRHHGYCFTVQTWDEEACASVMSLYKHDHNCTYVICGFEISPRTKKHHLQCYAYYREQITFDQMKKKLDGVHIEPQKSKLNVKAYCYCMEEYDYWEAGQRPRQGHRTDLEVIKHDLVTKKKTMKEVSKEYFAQYCQYSRQFDRFIEMHDLRVPRDTITYVYDESTIEKIYEISQVDSLIMRKDHFQWEDFLFNYYSKKYAHIFIPLYDFLLAFPLEKYNLKYLMEV